MDQMMNMDQLTQMQGSDVYASDGDKIGKVEEIYYDEATRQPEWIGIGTGFLRMKRVLVPVQGSTIRDEALYVPYGKDQVKDSPDIDGDEISTETEQQLATYYGLGYSYQSSDTGMPEMTSAGPVNVDASMQTAPPMTSTEADMGAISRGPTEGEASTTAGWTGVTTGQTTGMTGMTSDTTGMTGTSETMGGQTVTRSEEELRVGKMDTEAGRVRLRKWVETTPVSEQVELRKETAYVERQPINQPMSGATIGEQNVDVTLRQEQAVVQKDVVGKEQVSLGKEVETETQTVSDEVRQERVEVEGDAKDRGSM